MTYVCFLRGINVGGNNKVSMADLKQLFTELGFNNVSSYINSGNIIFESDEKDNKFLTNLIEKELQKNFKFEISIVVLSKEQLAKTIENVPDFWNKDKNLRCYFAFTIPPTTSKEAGEFIKINEEVDSLKLGKYGLYFSTKLEGITRSGITRLIGTPIYKRLTLRNYNTVKKVYSMM